MISICIPAYNRVDGLERLLASIRAQSFRDYEIVITDDSTNDAVQQFLAVHYTDLPIRYFKNSPSLGSPENWNEGIRKATGTWIKIMHDDDWFADAHALTRFMEAASQDTLFVFSGYNVIGNDGAARRVLLNSTVLKRMQSDPFCLLAENYVGHPSTTLFRKELCIWFDRSLKWLVDVDFYIRCFQKTTFTYTAETLVNIGKSDTQLTAAFFRRREIEIPEYFHVLEKSGLGMLRNIRVYDAWWRLFRNLGITGENDIKASGYSGKIPPVFLSMLRWQRTLGKRFLQIGACSKAFMLLHYVIFKPARIS